MKCTAEEKKKRKKEEEEKEEQEAEEEKKEKEEEEAAYPRCRAHNTLSPLFPASSLLSPPLYLFLILESDRGDCLTGAIYLPTSAKNNSQRKEPRCC